MIFYPPRQERGGGDKPVAPANNLYKPEAPLNQNAELNGLPR